MGGAAAAAAAGNMYFVLYLIFNSLFSFLLIFSCLPCSAFGVISLLASFSGNSPAYYSYFFSFLSAPFSLSLLFSFPFLFFLKLTLRAVLRGAVLPQIFWGAKSSKPWRSSARDGSRGASFFSLI